MIEEQIIEAVLPVIHINGTSKESLCSELESAYSALNAAYDAIKKTAPNGRDYYTAPGRMQQAEEQHRARLSMVQAVMDNIEAVLIGIDS